jgi:hypothetical protein
MSNIPTQKYSGKDTVPAQNIDANVKISGMGTIEGDLVCVDFNNSGSTKSLGNLTVRGSFKNSGMFRGHQDLIVHNKLESSGTLTQEGAISVGGKLKSSGIINIHGFSQITGETDFSGVTRLYNNVLARSQFKSSGVTTVGGNLMALRVEIWPDHPTLGLDFMKRWVRSTIHGSVFAEQEIKVRHVHIKQNIIARNVRIGKNALVEGVIYYVDSLQIEENPEIKQTPIQIPLAQFEATRAEWQKMIDKPLQNQTAVNEMINQESNIQQDGTSSASNPKFCPACGHSLEEALKFCPYCGFELQNR